MKWFDKEELFDITKSNPEAIREICQWFNDRCDEIHSEEREVSIDDNNVNISYSWEDNFRGCHMGTETEYFEIPNEIFFSDYSLSAWQREEADRIKEIAAKEKEAEDKKKRTQAKRDKTLATKKKEQKDKDEYERLKEKYEGEKK